MSRILLVLGSLNEPSATEVMLRDLERKIIALGAEASILDLRRDSLPLYIPGRASEAPNYVAIRARIVEADGIVLGTPNYHGGPSGALKNFLDFYWREFTGKLFGYVCASHEKGLTAMDALRTAVRQCYGWSLPYGVAGVESQELQTEPAPRITSKKLEDRLTMMAHDMVAYSQVLGEQRRRDIAHHEPTFVGILRPKK